MSSASNLKGRNQWWQAKETSEIPAKFISFKWKKIIRQFCKLAETNFSAKKDWLFKRNRSDQINKRRLSWKRYVKMINLLLLNTTKYLRKIFSRDGNFNLLDILFHYSFFHFCEINTEISDSKKWEFCPLDLQNILFDNDYDPNEDFSNACWFPETS